MSRSASFSLVTLHRLPGYHAEDTGSFGSTFRGCIFVRSYITVSIYSVTRKTGLRAMSKMSTYVGNWVTMTYNNAVLNYSGLDYF